MSEFIPKGGMCAVCEHRDEDCSAIEFKHCPVIEIDHSEDVKVVKCGDFVTYDRCFGDQELIFVGMAPQLETLNDCVVTHKGKACPVQYSGLKKIDT
jgi:hypothetical protein